MILWFDPLKFEIQVQIGPFFISVPTIVAVSGVKQYEKNIALESSIPIKKYHQKAWKYKIRVLNL